MEDNPKIRHFCLCGANLRSALITGILCTAHSLVYLVLWIIELVNHQFQPFHALAITFYVISLAAYILMILAATSKFTLKTRKSLMIASMVLTIIDAILGLVTFYFNVKTTMGTEKALLDQGNNGITWILSIGVCVWAAVLGYGAILEIQEAEDKTITDNDDSKDPEPKVTEQKNPFDEE